MPPSSLSDGRSYRIADPLDFFRFASAPEWLYDLMEGGSEDTRDTQQSAVPRPRRQRPQLFGGAVELPLRSGSAERRVRQGRASWSRQPQQCPQPRRFQPRHLGDLATARPRRRRDHAGRHCPPLCGSVHTGVWFEWTGAHWRKEDTDLALQFARALGREASDPKEARKITFASGSSGLHGAIAPSRS